MSLDLHVAHWGTQLVPAPVIVHADAFNGLAFDAHQTWAFKRAELTALAATPFRLANGEQASMSIIRTLPPLSVGADRMIAIGTRLLALTAPKLVALGPSASVGLVLCLPERMAIGREDRTFRAQRERIEKTLATALTGLEVVMHVEARGHASLAFALRQVANALADRTLLAAIVLGLDTYYDPLVVQGLLDRKRLWDGENLDAFVPGEGGFSLLVTTRAIARRAHLGVLASIESAASATEPAPLASTQTSMASGLSAATRAISDRLESEGRRIDWWMTDLTPEHYRAHELQLAWPRAIAGVSDPRRSMLDYPTINLGDLGAATMGTYAAIAVEGMRRGSPDARTCMITGTSEGVDRGAVLLAAEETRVVVTGHAEDRAP